jgi:hypothetical protein
MLRQMSHQQTMFHSDRRPSEKRAMKPAKQVAHVSIYVIHSRIFVQKNVYISSKRSKKRKTKSRKDSQQVIFACKQKCSLEKPT